MAEVHIDQNVWDALQSIRSDAKELARVANEACDIAAAERDKSNKVERALRELLSNYDEERGVIDCHPDGGCYDCTVGTVPNDLNIGLCAYHNALSLLKENRR